jgi:hypothetical protein
VLFSKKYNRAPGNSISRIRFSNITVSNDCAANMLPSRIEDYDAGHGVSDYSFSNVRIGKRRFDPKRDVERNRKDVERKKNPALQ